MICNLFTKQWSCDIRWGWIHIKSYPQKKQNLAPPPPSDVFSSSPSANSSKHIKHLGRWDFAASKWSNNMSWRKKHELWSWQTLPLLDICLEGLFLVAARPLIRGITWNTYAYIYIYRCQWSSKIPPSLLTCTLAKTTSPILFKCFPTRQPQGMPSCFVCSPKCSKFSNRRLKISSDVHLKILPGGWQLHGWF